MARNPNVDLVYQADGKTADHNMDRKMVCNVNYINIPVYPNQIVKTSIAQRIQVISLSNPIVVAKPDETVVAMV